ncbi:unnamed protein product [Closterium sp. Naga37s-1]|nr:unnamed protein product [Closterium sp. Naga37s-1]
MTLTRLRWAESGEDGLVRLMRDGEVQLRMAAYVVAVVESPLPALDAAALAFADRVPTPTPASASAATAAAAAAAAAGAGAAAGAAAAAGGAAAGAAAAAGAPGASALGVDARGKTFTLCRQEEFCTKNEKNGKG